MEPIPTRVKYGPNIVKNTKNPLYVLSKVNMDPYQSINQCIELKDGRILLIISGEPIHIYNSLNPTLIDLKIDFSKEIPIGVIQLDDGILIFICKEAIIKLVQLESKSYKVIRNIYMSQYLKSVSLVKSLCRLSNGQIIFGLHDKYYPFGIISVFQYDIRTKNLLAHLNYFGIADIGKVDHILEWKNYEILISCPNRGDDHCFFNIKEKKLF